jgi:FMN-dependent NADH-azoreductase
MVPAKEVYVVVTSGSVFSEGPYAVHDHFVRSIRGILGFIGLTDVEIIRVEGTANPATTADVVAAAKSNIDSMTLIQITETIRSPRTNSKGRFSFCLFWQEARTH